MPQLRSIRLAWLPIPVFLVAILVLSAWGPHDSHESAFLGIVLNLVFSTLVSLLVAYLIARSFLVRGTPGLLLLGCGVVLWGLAGVVATVSSRDPNIMVTIHNNCVWLSALCHLAGVSLSLRARRSISPTALWLPLGYLLAVGAVVVVTLAALAGWLPIFFVQGQGGTAVRQFVLISALAMFTLTALLLGMTGRRPLTAFTYWYALALGLIAVGLLGVSLQSSAGSILGWTGRAAQFLSGVYMLVAAVASVRESQVWGISLEAALRQSEERFRAFMDNSTAIAWLKDEEGRCVYLSKPYEQRFGVRLADWRGKTDFDLWPPETAEQFRRNDLHVLDTGQPLACIEETVNSDGSRSYWWNSKFLVPDGRGRRYVGGIGVDITERRRAEEALRELNATLESKVAQRTAELERERQRLYAVLEAIPAMVCLLTPDYHVAFANRSFREKFGDAKGRHCYEHCFGRTEPCDFCETYQVLETGRPHRWEVTAADGRTIIEAHDYPFIDVDGSPLILEMDLDITERKRAEAALKELNEALTRRARQLQKLTLELTQAEEQERRRIAVILHEDLQQQIAGAKFHLSMVKGRATDARMRADIEEVEAMLKDTIEQSRSLSRDLSPAVVHMNDLAEVLQWLAHRVQAQQGLTVHLEVRGDLMLRSEALALFLFRAVQEMLFNVIQHAQVREAAVRLRRVRRFVCLSVSDQGRGFDPQELKETSGVGLFSIRERTELLGGRMKVKSAPGEGSRFRIMVPDGQKPVGVGRVPKRDESRLGSPPRAYPLPPRAGSPAYPTSVGTDGQEKEGGHGGPPLRVLLVDDHDGVRKGLAAMLRGEPGIELLGEAPDGRQGIALAADLRPDVVIMDVSLPLMKGDEATRQIKSYLPQTRVIALSMYDDAEKQQSMFEAGAESYLLKTIAAADLIAAIRSPNTDRS